MDKERINCYWNVMQTHLGKDNNKYCRKKKESFNKELQDHLLNKTISHTKKEGRHILLNLLILLEYGLI